MGIKVSRAETIAPIRSNIAGITGHPSKIPQPPFFKRSPGDDMLSVATTTLLVVCVTMVAALPFLLAELNQRRRTRAMKENPVKRVRAS
jgi:hypothetical protein